MQEGSPPDPAPESPAPEATPPAEQAPVAPEAATPEQIEAIWKNRVAGKDRAHAAAEGALRDQIAELNSKLAGKTAVDAENMSEVEREKARADAAEARAESIERQRVVDLRQVKYAEAAAILDPAELAVIDEARLAALNARLTGGEATPPSVIDPNAARRPSSTTPAAPRDRSIEELEADLKNQAPAYSESLNQ